MRNRVNGNLNVFLNPGESYLTQCELRAIRKYYRLGIQSAGTLREVSNSLEQMGHAETTRVHGTSKTVV